MKNLSAFAISTTIALFILAGCSPVMRTNASPGNAPSQKLSRKTMRPFRSMDELAKYLRELAEKQTTLGRDSQVAPQMIPKATPSSDATTSTKDKVAGVSSESVTNVQHAGVDEGGIVKVHGNYLVILRRGRLFTVAINNRSLRPVSVVDSFGPGIDAEDTWYDEMLISGNTIAVIGYSYAHGGTEVGLFNIDNEGGLRYRSTYHLRSDDYYSSRNYASRLIGSKLIFYTPLNLSPDSDEPFEEFPAVRKWHRGATDEEFRRIVPATRVYRPEKSINQTNGLALHTVTVCDLSNGYMDCAATAVIGPPGRVFYVSPESVYVWVSDITSDDGVARTNSMVYRMPLNGSAPSAVAVSGSPVDQFSFLEGSDGNLNVLVSSEAAGDEMWNPEGSAGDLALLRIPLWSFSDGSYAAPASSYRSLAKPKGGTFQNRFVGDYLLYGIGSGWGPPENVDASSLFAVHIRNGSATELQLTHGVDRIDVMGSGAVVIGTDGEDLHFSGIRLSDRPALAQRYIRRGASQGELRSHGFFYKEDGDDTGIIGLPISAPGREGYEHLFEESSAILFLRNDSNRFSEAGELDSKPERAVDDNCRASCTDWYGNARPLFLRGRIFALMGYEIVEGTLAHGRIRETQRVSFAPRRSAVSQR